MGLVATPAFLLRAHDYGDSSRILKFYTRALGPVSLVAHGIRTRTGKGGGTTTTFCSGELVFYLKEGRELQTLKEFNATKNREGLGRNMVSFAGAASLAELILSHAAQEGNPPIFDLAEELLDGLEKAGTDRAGALVLSGLWRLVAAFGFSPRLEECALCGRPPGSDVGRLDLNAGGIRCGECSEDLRSPRLGPVARRQIEAFLDGTPSGSLLHLRAHLSVLGSFVTHHVTGKPVESFSFLSDVLPADPTGRPSVRPKADVLPSDPTGSGSGRA